MATTTSAQAAPLVGGYHAIALPLAAGGLFRRFIYVKKHLVKQTEEPGESRLAAERTVYVANLPSGAADLDAWLRAHLEPAVGAVQHVVVSGSASGNAASDPLLARSAHVVFKSASALKKVLKLQQLDGVQEDEEEERKEATGLRKYLRQYRANKPGLAAVKAIADQFMSKFDADEEEVRCGLVLVLLCTSDSGVGGGELMSMCGCCCVLGAGLSPARGAQGAGGRRRLQDGREHEEAVVCGGRGARTAREEAKVQGDERLLPLPDA